MDTGYMNIPPPWAPELQAYEYRYLHKTYPCLSAQPAADSEGVDVVSHVGGIGASLGVTSTEYIIRPPKIAGWGSNIV